jgi:uncharacterized membrane protein HdeD (DUF308 family)
MLERLTRNWWLLVVRGVAAVLFGLLALIWPDVTLTALVLLFGAYALVDGVATIGVALAGRGIAGGERVWLALEGLLGVAAGILTFIWPGITGLVLLWLIAFWALVTGVIEIVAAIRLRRELDNEWLLILGGVASLLFGLVLVFRPGTGALAVAWLIGLYALLFGAVLIALGLRLRGVDRQLRTA